MGNARVLGAVGAALIGLGLACMIAARQIAAGCVDCEEESPEQTADEVAHASAEMNGAAVADD